MNKHNLGIVGAGIIGLTTAWKYKEKFPESKIFIVEKSDHVAAEQTGHNSNVCHGGIYYSPGSLKADFCKRGNAEIKEFCYKYDLPIEEIGKMIVATNPLEVERLHSLYERGLINGLDLEKISKEELAKREPNIEGLEAIFLKSTAIVDFKKICETLRSELEKKDVLFLQNFEVDRLEKVSESEVKVYSKNSSSLLSAEKVVVCAGIQVDRIARKSGYPVDWIYAPFKGEYFQLDPKFNDVVSTLIYPVPDPEMPFLGVHLTPMTSGIITVGPNAVLGLSRTSYKKLGFSIKDMAELLKFPGFWKLAKKLLKTGIIEQWNSLYRPGYLKQVQKYCPKITLKDIKPYPPGIRAQAVDRNGEMIEDFDLRKDGNIIYCVNLPSPAATSSGPSAEYIIEKLEA